MNTFHPDGAAHRMRQMLTFGIGDQSFGVDLLCVQEIRGWSPVTRVPNGPAHGLGILNFRGAVIPVFDARVCMGVAAAELTPLNVIIVLASSVENPSGQFGIVVDRVDQVVDIDAEQLQPMPQVGGAAAVDVIRGLATTGDHMVVLLAPDRLLAFQAPFANAAAA